LISRAGRAFRAEVVAILNDRRLTALTGPLAVAIDLFPPDRRRRDVDNAIKSLLDALQHGGAYADDHQIDELHVRRRECVRGGFVHVQIQPCPPIVLVPDTAKPRTCLKCGREFPSPGPGHRICSTCRAKNMQFDLGERDLQAQRGAKRRNGEDMIAGHDEAS